MSDYGDYYAPTAYDSTGPRELPPRTPREKWSHATKGGRGNDPSLAWGVYFGDFRNSLSACTIRDLKGKKAKWLKDLSAETLRFTSVYNPKGKWAMLMGVAGLTSIAMLLTIFLAVMAAGSRFFEKNPSTLLLFFVPFAFFVIGALGTRFAKDKYNIIFNRRTGLVTLPMPNLKKLAPHFPPESERNYFVRYDLANDKVDFRFDELDGYIRYETTPAGGVFWQLTLGHRVRNGGVEPPDAQASHKANVFQIWELLQHFMDISKPLPETATLEPVRHLDPVTAAYDKKTGRPAHFWRDMDPEEAKRLAERVSGVMHKFPWEFLPRGNEPYGQYDSAVAWRHIYPKDAAVVDALRDKGWWDSTGKQTPSWDALKDGFEPHK